MKWYKLLTNEQRYYLRTHCEKIVGITWEQLGILFSCAERIEIIYTKLKIEGLIRLTLDGKK